MRSAKAVVSENRYSGLDRSQLDGSLPQDQSRMPSRTITGLKRWSVSNRDLPGGFYLVLQQKFIQWLANGVAPHCSHIAGKSYPCLRFRQHM